jgi:hypothetical protein
MTGDVRLYRSGEGNTRGGSYIGWERTQWITVSRQGEATLHK